MVRLTAEQMAALAHLEKNLEQAYRHNFIRLTATNETEKVRNIYKTATGSNEFDRARCPSCILTLFKRVGQLYFYTKENPAEVNDQPNKQNKKQPTKRTRKK